MDEKGKKYLRDEYVARINRVIDYIESNLGEDLSLGTLAGVASFSPYHFHRIFRGIVGETLNQYIGRLRVEKAADQLINNPRKSITEIAMGCGFSSPATFARAFKEAFDMSASQWRSGGYLRDRKNCKIDDKGSKRLSNTGKDFDLPSWYIDVVNQTWRVINMKNDRSVQIEVKEIPDFHVAYVRHIGPYKGDSALFENLFGKLMRWAGPRGLLSSPDTRVLAIYHDNPEITEENNLRVSVCVTIPEGTPVEGEIGKMLVPGGKYAFARFELAADQYQEAWDLVFSQWLPESGYQPDDRPCFEMCHNDPKDHPENKHIVDICVPVRPL
ncbi:MAG: AraC family transcriptional regulator [Bacillota bacterium]